MTATTTSAAADAASHAHSFLAPDSKIVIVGAGVFGLSTALALARYGDTSMKQNFTKVHVLDRMPPPVANAGSTDISRIIRPDYPDPVYAGMEVRAISKYWNNSPHFYPCGLLVCCERSEPPSSTPASSSSQQLSKYYSEGRYTTSHVLANCERDKLAQQGQDSQHGRGDQKEEEQQQQAVELLTEYTTVDEIRRVVPAAGGSLVPAPWPPSSTASTGTPGAPTSLTAYLNPMAGWANAAEASRAYADECRDAGVTFHTDNDGSGTVTELIATSSDAEPSLSTVTGVRVATGDIIEADLVILATGGWTPSLLKRQEGESMNRKDGNDSNESKVASVSDRFVTTGQPVCMIQLTPEERKQFATMPVTLNHSSGVYIFPPTPEDGILKAARHSYGYVVEEPLPYPPPGDDGVIRNNSSASSSDTTTTKGHLLPTEAADALRREVATFYGPEIASRPFCRSRICSYNDTSNGDFVFDYHPSYTNLFVCTGGSGHGFKFLPVIGENALECLFNKGSRPEQPCDQQETNRGRSKAVAKAEPIVDKFSWKGKIPIEKTSDIDGSRAGPPRMPLEMAFHY